MGANTGIKLPVVTWQKLKCMLAIVDKIAHGSNTVLLSNFIAGQSLFMLKIQKYPQHGILDKYVITTDAATYLIGS